MFDSIKRFKSAGKAPEAIKKEIQHESERINELSAKVCEMAGFKVGDSVKWEGEDGWTIKVFTYDVHMGRNFPAVKVYKEGHGMQSVPLHFIVEENPTARYLAEMAEMERIPKVGDKVE